MNLLTQRKVPNSIVPIVEVISQLPCAWCMEEQGVPLGEGTHGICQSHADNMVIQRNWQRLQSISNIDTQAAERRARSLRV